MKKIIIILLLYLINTNIALSLENQSNDGILCSYNGRDIKYTNQELYELVKQCDYATDEIIFLVDNGYTSEYFFENFPYFSNFYDKCIRFLHSTGKDENGNDILSFGNKDCKSYQDIIYAGTEFEIKVKQESIKINNLVKKVKQNRS